jgi:hypothetical protein
MLERLTRPSHGGRAPFKEFEHRGRHHGMGQAMGLSLVLVGQHPCAGHIEVDYSGRGPRGRPSRTHFRAAVQSPNPDKIPHRSLNPKADQLHRVLQLMA